MCVSVVIYMQGKALSCDTIIQFSCSDHPGVTAWKTVLWRHTPRSGGITEAQLLHTQSLSHKGITCRKTS